MSPTQHTTETRKFISSIVAQLDTNIMRLKSEMENMPLSKIAEDMAANITLCNGCLKACIKAINQ